MLHPLSDEITLIYVIVFQHRTVKLRENHEELTFKINILVHIYIIFQINFSLIVSTNIINVPMEHFY